MGGGVLSAISGMFLKWAGYDPAVVARLSPQVAGQLGLASIWSLLGMLLCSVAGTYLVYLGINAGRLLSVIPALAFGVIFFFGFNMQRMFITSGGFGYHGSLRTIATWEPERLRLVLVVFLALLFTQPLLLLLNRAEIGMQMQDRIDMVTSVYRSDQLGKINRQRDALLTSKAALDEKLQLLGVMRQVAADGMKAKTSGTLGASRRKALVIGMQRYRSAASSGEQIKDANAVGHALSAMGYQVTISEDADHDDVLLATDRYLKTLRPGDLSFVYLAGYAAVRSRQRYLLPVDFDAEHAKAGLKLTQLMDDIAATSPQANVILLDAVQLPASSSWQDLSEAGALKASPNSVLAMAYGTPMPNQLTQPAQRSIFTQALLRHMRRGEDIAAIIQYISDDMRDAAKRASGRLSPRLLTASSLHQTYTQLSGTTPAVDLPIELLAKELRGLCDSAIDRRSVEKCLLASTDLLQAQLAEIDRKAGPGLERNVAAYRDSVQRSGMVRQRWLMLWTDKWSNLGLTLICVFLIAGGDLLRDLRVAPLRHYERERWQIERAAIERRFWLSRKMVNDSLAAYPSTTLPGPRWHEFRSYFELDMSSTPLCTPDFESHGSADDLLARLAFSGYPTKDRYELKDG